MTRQPYVLESLYPAQCAQCSGEGCASCENRGLNWVAADAYPLPGRQLLAHRIARRITPLGWSRLAEAGYPAAKLVPILDGSVAPSSLDMARLAEAAGCTFDDLFWAEDWIGRCASMELRLKAALDRARADDAPPP